MQHDDAFSLYKNGEISYGKFGLRNIFATISILLQLRKLMIAGQISDKQQKI
jgi:hypothetical protein